MCGISGILINDNSISKKKLTSNINKVNNTMNHRGPDDDGLWVNESKGIGLGHKRLSIIDLSKNGRQPFVSSSGRYKLVFNGEIYNYVDIKKELSVNKNIKWKSSSDTEVLAEAIEIWGIDKTLEKISGMYSFAIWDDHKNILSLIRDKFGIKPLYYGYIDEALVFSSELKGIKAYASNKLEISKTALNNFLRYSYVPNPQTIYKCVFQLEPGQIITFHRGKKINEKKFWNSFEQANELKKNKFYQNDNDVMKNLEKVILESVESHMISDVKVGAFLSGGIDSTLVTAMMQRSSSINVDTFSIGFENDLFDESKYAKVVAKELKTNHHEYILKEKELEDSIYKIPAIFDEPFGDSSSIPTLLLSQKTSDNVKVALSGDGGDEMFAGYNRYIYANKVWKFLDSRSKLEKNILATFLESQSEKTINFLSPLYKFILKDLKLQNFGQTLKKIPKLINSKTKLELYHNIISIIKSPNIYIMDEMRSKVTYEKHKLLDNFEFIEQMMLSDLNDYLVNDILCKVDRTSMHHSLEVRVPLISQKVFDAAWKIPLSYKLSERGNGKIILKKILGKYLNTDIFDRPKMGFGIPIDQWLRNELKGMLQDVLGNKSYDNSGLLNYSEIKKTISKHNKGSNYGSELWNLLMFELWYKSQKSV